MPRKLANNNNNISPNNIELIMGISDINHILYCRWSPLLQIIQDEKGTVTLMRQERIISI